MTTNVASATDVNNEARVKAAGTGVLRDHLAIRGHFGSANFIDARRNEK